MQGICSLTQKLKQQRAFLFDREKELKEKLCKLQNQFEQDKSHCNLKICTLEKEKVQLDQLVTETQQERKAKESALVQELNLLQEALVKLDTQVLILKERVLAY